MLMFWHMEEFMCRAADWESCVSADAIVALSGNSPTADI